MCRCLNQFLLKTVLEDVVENHSTLDLELSILLLTAPISYIQKHALNARPPNSAFLENEHVLRVSLGEWLRVFGMWLCLGTGVPPPCAMQAPPVLLCAAVSSTS